MEEVIIGEYGTTLGKKSERLIIRQKGKVVREVPFFKLGALTFISKGCSISVDAIRECVERGIHINFLDFTGQPYARLSSPNLTGTVKTRREQLQAYQDDRGVTLAKAFIIANLKNKLNIIRYFSRHRKEQNREVFRKLEEYFAEIEKNTVLLEKVQGAKIDDVRGEMMGIEGRSGRVYWEGVKLILEGNVVFPGRKHRGATDPVNSLLNYGYGILYSRVWGAIILAGLEPFAGFMHVDRPGRPSLVLDLIEEFRQQVVDRVVISFFTKGGQVKIKDGLIEDNSRKDFTRRILERFEARERYGQGKTKIKNIIQKQAHSLAVFVREGGRYRPFIGGW